MKLSNKVYDVLKVIAWIAIPLSAFLATLADILGVPVMKTLALVLTALDTFVGALLHDSNKKYNAENTNSNSLISDEINEL